MFEFIFYILSIKYSLINFFLVILISNYSSQQLLTSMLLEFLRKDYKLSSFVTNLTGSSIFIGFLIGSIISGKLENCFKGRRKFLILSGLMIFSTTAILGYVKYITIFIILRIITGIICGASDSMCLSLIIEISPIKIKGLVSGYSSVAFSFGYLYLTFICFEFLQTLTKGSTNMIFIFCVKFLKIIFFL